MLAKTINIHIIDLEEEDYIIYDGMVKVSKIPVEINQ